MPQGSSAVRPTNGLYLYLFKGINDWFHANLLSLNTDKNYFMQFSTKNSSLNNMNITYDNNVICNISNMKFIGMNIYIYIYVYIYHTHMGKVILI